MSALTERNKATIRTAIGAWAAGDVKVYARLFHPDLKWTVIGSTKISGDYHSRDDLFTRMGAVLEASLENALAPRIIDMIGEGDWISLRLESHATARNGTPYHQQYCWVLRLLDDRIVEGTAYMDTALVRAVTE